MTRHLAGLCLAFLFAHALAATPTVMLVNSYHAGYAWSQAWRTALAASLGNKVQLVYTELDSKHLPRDTLQAVDAPDDANRLERLLVASWLADVARGAPTTLERAGYGALAPARARVLWQLLK